MLTQEKINLNFVTFCKKLEKYNCYSERMMAEMGELIKNCSFALNEDSGSAYDGSMIDVVLNTLCSAAYNINEAVLGVNNKFSHMKVNTDMLMRVLLLQHISKAEMFVPQTEPWKYKKGLYYDFNQDLASTLKLGERSLYLCQKYGIELAEEEYEAIRIIDKLDDDKINSFVSPLCLLVKMANQLTAVTMKQRHDLNNKKEKMEE